jgi:septal ring factor EnvC (AmiA/AmiB activator)
MVKNSMRRFVTVLVALVLMAGFLLIDSNAQKRRRRRRAPSAPRITNPAIYQPSPADNSNSSGDTSNTVDPNTTDTQPARSVTDQDPEGMKKTIRTLSTQVDKLSDKLSQMEENQRSLVDLERLSRAEARSTALRAELRDVQSKEADLQAKAEDTDYALKPENIERSVAGYGTTHPEELRDQRRRQLENEKARLRKQLDQLASSHTRLEEAIATADAEVERLRKKLDAADEAAIQNAKTKAQSEGTSSSEPGLRPTPTPTPPPR